MVKIIKLSLGEEIVGELISENDSSFFIKNVYVIMYRFHPFSTNPTVKLVPYMMFGVNNNFEFKKSYIVNQTDAREAFAEYYFLVVKNNTDKNQIDMIDDELRTAINLIKSNSKEEMYNSILESFQKPDSVN